MAHNEDNFFVFNISFFIKVGQTPYLALIVLVFQLVVYGSACVVPGMVSCSN